MGILDSLFSGSKPRQYAADAGRGSMEAADNLRRTITPIIDYGTRTSQGIINRDLDAGIEGLDPFAAAGRGAVGSMQNALAGGPVDAARRQADYGTEYANMRYNDPILAEQAALRQRDLDRRYNAGGMGLSGAAELAQARAAGEMRAGYLGRGEDLYGGQLANLNALAGQGLQAEGAQADLYRQRGAANAALESDRANSLSSLLYNTGIYKDQAHRDWASANTKAKQAVGQNFLGAAQLGVNAFSAAMGGGGGGSAFGNFLSGFGGK